jgi:hypothetical protein
MDNQSLGLAEALGCDVVEKFVEPVAPWKFIPPQLWVPPLSFYGARSDRFEPPWPDVLIGTGRQTIAASLAVSHASKGETFTVRIQDPHTRTRPMPGRQCLYHSRCAAHCHAAPSACRRASFWAAVESAPHTACRGVGRRQQ